MDERNELERGRQFYEKRAWMDAHTSLSQADQTAALGAEDLEFLATAGYMLGRYDDYVSSLERAHHLYLDTGEALRASRCAFWMGVDLASRGEMGPATGWFGRAQRLVERGEGECVEEGYLLLPIVLQQEAAGNWEAAYAVAADAAEIGERFADVDLTALAVHAQGRALLKQGRVGEGLGLLDEAMVAVTTGELSPIVTGLIYCSVIEGCQDVYELRRAQEWTAALTRWCEEQPDLVSFTGKCLMHRSEIMCLHGAWGDALEEAQRAGERLVPGVDEISAGQVSYQRAEVYRLRGEFAAAEEAYREASRTGWEPQPGLALLRLAQGDNDAAAAAIRRVVGETTDPLKRARLLPAFVEVMLAVGDVQEARSACRELDEISAEFEASMLRASAAHARGAVDLAEGDAWAALVALRHAGQVWQELGVPYEAARVRVHVALACRSVGDEDTATLELEAARDALAQLGAAPELARLEELFPTEAPKAAGGLTPRELQVLRLVVAGNSNRAIAAELVLSERTVDRHVSNIYSKLGVSSRAAATAYAYEHQLV